MFPNKGCISDVADVHSSNDGSHSKFAGEEKSQETEGEPSQLTEENKQRTEREIRGGHTEIRSMYQKLVDGKSRYAVTNDRNELKDILKEAKNLISRLKGTQGQWVTEDIEIFRLLCDTVKEMSKDLNTKEQNFHMEEYAHKLTSKFNFSTDNSGNIIVTKRQVVSLGKAISKYFSKAPTIKLVLGALDTVEGEMNTTMINDLPHELMRYIFLMLPLQDLKMAVLVSQWWRKVGEDPVLWKWCVITIQSGEDINKLSLRRIKHVQKICVDPNWNGQAQQLEDLLKATLELPKLKEIEELQWIDCSSVNLQLFARALVRLEKLLLTNATNNDQRVAVFNEMAENSSIKNLTVLRIDLSTLELDAGVLAKALSGVEQLVLTYVLLNNDQAQKLLESISDSNQLNAVYFSSLSLSSVNPELFGTALAQVETLNLRGMEVTPQQVWSLLAEMDGRSKMRSIAITEIDMSATDPKLFAGVMSKLDQVTLVANNLTNQQVQQLFTKMKQNSSKISSLDLSDNDLSPVDPDDLANVVNNIEEVDLSDTDLSTEQITAVLMHAQTNTKLQKLAVPGNRISQVDPTIITRAKKIIGELDIDTEDEDEDDSSDEEDSLDGFIVSENDSEDENEDEDKDEDEDDSLDGFIASESDIELDGDKESDGGN